MSYRITQLNYYPVKSLKGLTVDQAEIDAFGVAGDRRFMLVDIEGKFITQRTHPILSQLVAFVVQDTLIVQHESFGELSFLVQESGEEISVTVWRDAVSAVVLPCERLDKLEAFIGCSLRVVYMPDSSFHQVDREFFDEQQRVSFADGFPLLLTNEASLADLNAKLEQPVPMWRFRPNLVFSGDAPFQEDDWQRIRVGEVEFALVKPCSRCVMTTIDEHGNKSKEPLRTLATYRKNEFGVCFGQNLVQLNQGVIRVGDTLEVLA